MMNSYLWDKPLIPYWIHQVHCMRTVQELHGHSDASTTMNYTHVLNKGGRGVRNPLDLGSGIGQPLVAQDVTATYRVPGGRAL